MKDNRRSPFINDISKTLSADLYGDLPKPFSYVRFNHFHSSQEDTGTRFRNLVTNTAEYEISLGDRGGNTGNFSPTTGSIKDFDIYGQSVFSDERFVTGEAARVVMRQAGLSMPLSSDAVFVSKKLSDTYNGSSDYKLQIMLKMRLRPGLEQSNLSVITLASGGDPTQDVVSLVINNDTIEALWESSNSSRSSPSVSLTDKGFVTVFIGVGAFNGTTRTESWGVFDSVTGEELSTRQYDMPHGDSVSGTPKTLANPAIYIGYGNHAVNNDFNEDDFAEVDIAEIALFDEFLTISQMRQLVEVTIPNNIYKSGFNNRPPKKVQQLLDARTVYPQSANPLSSTVSTPAFNDTSTKVFGSAPVSGSVMFPEMLPAYMFSGSADDRGALGDVKNFYRDAHQTDYEKRLVAPGFLRQGLSHKETELLNKASRNSPIVIGEDADALGGTIEPFNDNHPLADKNEQPAVDENLIPGLNQRLGDHVAIIIDVTPSEETTIGVERDAEGVATGRVTSMAYFNFSTKKWETAGKNNDFIIPGAVTVTTGANDAADYLTKQQIAAEAGIEHIFRSASLGFAGTSGFTIWQNAGKDALASLAQRGAPTSNYGFPTAAKYEAKDSQTIDMSDYIDSPFIVERVSMEFGAAVEDSGPHSLGYRQELPSAMDVESPTTKQLQSISPQMTFSVAQSSSEPVHQVTPNSARERYIGRGEFIGGTEVMMNSNLPYRVDVPNFNGFTHSSAAPLASILLGRNEFSRQDSSPTYSLGGGQNYDFYVSIGKIDRPLFRFVGGDSASRAYDEKRYARFLMPTVLGPRAAGYQALNKRLSDSNLTPTYQVSPGKPLAYIPILAGGLNGVVTGSNEKFLTDGPWGLVRYNTSGPHPVSNSSVPAAAMSTDGGVPFWRADTFFLLRQSKSDEKVKKKFNFTAFSSREAIMSPLAPYSEWDAVYMDHGGNSQGIRRPNLYSKWIASSENFEFDDSSSTSRDMITFGQMTHFGYASAADSYVDTIFDTPYINSSVSGSHAPGLGKGGHNVDFWNQIFDGTTDTAKDAILFGQALKIDFQADFGNVVIPSNPAPLISDNSTNNNSMLSDAPDTFQGQNSFIAGERPNNNTHGKWAFINENPFSVLNGNKREGGKPRYYSQGEVTDRGGSGKKRTLTLDTWVNPSPTTLASAYDGKQMSPNSPSRTNYWMAQPHGSGFSIISTPAWPTSRGSASPTRRSYDGSADMANDYSAFGSFFDVASKERLVTVRGDVPTETWLEAGLGKETNIQISQGHTHEGKNIDFDDNWSGFTLMTASTIWRPFSSPGRESASSPLVANVYKRQYLNYQKSISLEMPVKSNMPTNIEAPGYWVTTCDNIRQSKATYNGPSAADGRILIPEESDQTITTGRAYQIAASAKRFHQRNSHLITAGGFRPGAFGDGMSSSRNFFRATGASTPSDILGAAAIPYGPNRQHRTSEVGEIYDWARPSPLRDMIKSSELSGSNPTETSVDSLYVLKPSDKLVLGLQPSLPGWNPGSGLPNNRHSSKYGVWDYKRSAEVGKAVTHDLENNGLDIRKDSLMNLEDPYEPCHGLTMLKQPSRLILYGTFVRNNKHYSPSSKQQLRSAAVHEALHYDNPVLDQFLTDNQYEYAGSNLAQHITGSILEGDRGVAGTLAEGSLTFSGSFQRFTRTSETSQVFYDTLLQDPFAITGVDGASTTPSPKVWANWVSLHMPSEWISRQTLDYINADSFVTDYGFRVYGAAFSWTWADSFPFEEKYSSVPRLVSRDLSFALESRGTDAGLGIEFPPDGVSIGLATPMVRKSYNPNTTVVVPGHVQSFSIFTRGLEALTGSNPNVIPYSYYEHLEGVANADEVTYHLGGQVAGIHNMANTKTLDNELDYSNSINYAVDLINSSFAAKRGQPAKVIAAYRRFAAAMVGYGRQNRKQLDYGLEFYLTFSEAENPPATPPYSDTVAGTTGYSTFFHPAGFKYGYMNCDHLSPSAVHRADHYGQFRDMLEQRLYGKVYSFGDQYNKRGESESAVTCIFVDADGAPIEDATKTSCLNLSTTATSGKPFIEGEVLREVIINSESVTIEI